MSLRNKITSYDLKYNLSEENDRLYYNVAIPHNDSLSFGQTPAIFQTDFSQALLQNPSEWYVCIVRYTVPSNIIPIFIPRILPFPNTDPNLTEYSVTLSYNGADSTQNIIFVTTQPSNPVPPGPSINHPLQYDTPYYYVYSYQEWIDDINRAINTAFAALPGKPAGATAPYFIFDSTTRLISLVAQRAFYNEALPGPGPIRLYINLPLLPFLDAIEGLLLNANPADPKNFQFLIKDNKNNWYTAPFETVACGFTGATGPVGCPCSLCPPNFIMTQEYDILANWNTLVNIQFISTLLGNTLEYVPIASNNQNVNSINNQNLNGVGVLTDFEPLLQLGPEARTQIQFQQTGPYRLINLNGTDPLFKFDLKVYWVDKFGIQRLLYLTHHTVLTVKFLFIRKSSYRNDK